MSDRNDDRQRQREQRLSDVTRQLKEVRLRIQQGNRLMSNLTYDLLAVRATYHSSTESFSQRERDIQISSIERQIQECQWNLNDLEVEERRLGREEYELLISS